MTPRMCDQFMSLRRELKDVQRALVDLQRRLPPASIQQEPPQHAEDALRGRSTMHSRVHVIDGEDHDADQSYSAAVSFPGTVEHHLDAGRQLSCVSDLPPSRDLVQRQNATHFDHDHHDDHGEVERTAANASPQDPTDDDPSAAAVFTLCL